MEHTTTHIGLTRCEALRSISQNYRMLEKPLQKHFNCDCCRLHYDELPVFGDPDNIPTDHSVIANINNRLIILSRVFNPYGREAKLINLLGERLFEKKGYKSVKDYFIAIYGNTEAYIICNAAKGAELYTFNCKNCISLDDDDFFRMMRIQIELEDAEAAAIPEIPF
jgi:hypothetical protein